MEKEAVSDYCHSSTCAVHLHALPSAWSSSESSREAPQKVVNEAVGHLVIGFQMCGVYACAARCESALQSTHIYTQI
jgi:hypothetical protein